MTRQSRATTDGRDMLAEQDNGAGFLIEAENLGAVFDATIVLQSA